MQVGITAIARTLQGIHVCVGTSTALSWGARISNAPGARESKERGWLVQSGKAREGRAGGAACAGRAFTPQERQTL